MTKTKITDPTFEAEQELVKLRNQVRSLEHDVGANKAMVTQRDLTIAELKGQVTAYQNTISMLTGVRPEGKHGNLRSLEDSMLRELGFAYGPGFRRGY